MKTATTLSMDIQTIGENAKYDTAVKRLLAEKIILAWILKSCVSEFKDTDLKDIADKYIEGEPQISEISVMPDEVNASLKIKSTGVEDITVTEGTVVFDIRFEAVAPKDGQSINLIINVEAQNDFYPGYPLIKRGIYYCSRMISSQYGTVFTKSHYEALRKVYSIWVCTDPPEKWKNTITKYSIKEENCVGIVKERTENYDLLTSVMVCLGSTENGNNKGVLKLLSVLLSSDIGSEEKMKVLERDFNIPMTEKMGRKVSEMCNLGQGVMEKAWQRGIQEGREKGIQEGRQEGWQEGILEGVKKTAKKLMAIGIPVETISDATGLSVEELKRLS